MSREERPHPSRLIASTVRVLREWAPTPLVEPPADDVGIQSPSMQQVMAMAARVAPSDSTVLITGESGVGKERLARWLHAASRRAQGPFLAVNCGAFAETLLESELFGHARGAFTGASQHRPGVFEAAEGGTLFLDEIGDTSPAMQVKLLRVLQEREIRRVGETKARRINVRLIAATHHDLMQEVAQRRFRQDLYYRLCVIDVRIPPLRERPEDLRALALAFLARAGARLHRSLTGYAPAALDRLVAYDWPGNIRELEHAVERACTVAAGPWIELDDLPPPVRHAPTARGREAPAQPLRDLEREHVLAVLARYQGDRRRTIEELRISLSTLKRKLRPRPLRATDVTSRERRRRGQT